MAGLSTATVAATPDRVVVPGVAERASGDADTAFPDAVVAETRVRLRRAAGQVNAVERMLAEGRSCTEVTAQLSAALRALEHAGVGLLTGALAACLDSAADSDAKEAAKVLFERLFLELS